MQPNSGYNIYGNTPAMVPVGAYSAPPSQQHGASLYDENAANVPPVQASVAMVDVSANHGTVHPVSHHSSVQVAYPSQYVYGNQPAPAPSYSAVPAFNNGYSQSRYSAPVTPYSNDSSLRANPVPVAATIPTTTTAPVYPNREQAWHVFVTKLCWYSITIGVVLLIIGIVLLATAPHRDCPDGCERDKCYVHHDDNNVNNDDGNKHYPCTCSDGGTGTDHCRNPTYSTGSPGYYHMLFGVLHMSIGGVAFFGGWIVMRLTQWAENLRLQREYYISQGLPVPGFSWFVD